MKELPLVTDLDAEGRSVSWTEPDGTTVLIVNGALPLRAEHAVKLCRPRRSDVQVES